MIRVRLSNGDFIFGITDENVRRLTHGQALSLDLKMMGGHDHVYITYGPTEADIMREMEKALGEPLPPPTAWPPNTDKP